MFSSGVGSIWGNIDFTAIFNIDINSFNLNQQLITTFTVNIN